MRIKGLITILLSSILAVDCLKLADFSTINIDATEPAAPEVVTIGISNVDYLERYVKMAAKVTSSGYPQYYEKGFQIASDQDFLDRQIITLQDTVSVLYEIEYDDWQFTPPFYIRPYIKSTMAISYGDPIRIEAEFVDYPIIGLSIQSHNNTPAEWDVSNRVCAGSLVGGYSDWRLPTRTELYAIYSMSDKLTNFDGQTFWAYDMADVMHHYALDFSSGMLVIDNGSYYGRCVRDLEF